MVIIIFIIVVVVVVLLLLLLLLLLLFLLLLERHAIMNSFYSHTCKWMATPKYDAVIPETKCGMKPFKGVLQGK